MPDHPSPFDRLTLLALTADVALSEAATAALLSRANGDPQSVEQLAGAASASDAVLEQLVGTGAPAATLRVALDARTRRPVPPDNAPLLLRLADGERRRSVLAALSDQPDLPDTLTETLLASDDAVVLARLARNPSAGDRYRQAAVRALAAGVDDGSFVGAGKDAAVQALRSDELLAVQLRAGLAPPDMVSFSRDRLLSACPDDDVAIAGYHTLLAEELAAQLSGDRQASTVPARLADLARSVIDGLPGASDAAKRLVAASAERPGPTKLAQLREVCTAAQEQPWLTLLAHGPAADAAAGYVRLAQMTLTTEEATVAVLSNPAVEDDTIDRVRLTVLSPDRLRSLLVELAEAGQHARVVRIAAQVRHTDLVGQAAADIGDLSLVDRVWQLWLSGAVELPTSGQRLLELAARSGRVAVCPAAWAAELLDGSRAMHEVRTAPTASQRAAVEVLNLLAGDGPPARLELALQLLPSFEGTVDELATLAGELVPGA